LNVLNRSKILNFEAIHPISLELVGKWNGIAFLIVMQRRLWEKAWSLTFIRGFCVGKRNKKVPFEIEAFFAYFFMLKKVC